MTQQEVNDADKTDLYKALHLRLEYDINANTVAVAVMATAGTGSVKLSV
jgi:hypothetical protein